MGMMIHRKRVEPKEVETVVVDTPKEETAKETPKVKKETKSRKK